MPGASRLVSILCWGGLAVVAAGFAAYSFTTMQDHRRRAIRPEDGCLAYSAAPAILAVVDDGTDPLTGNQPRRWRAALEDEIAPLQPGSLLLFATVQASAPTELQFETLCVPLKGRGALPEGLQRRFKARLKAIEKELEHSPSSPKSPISRTLLAVANDPAFSASKSVGPRRILVASDLMENDVASAYAKGGLVLPAPAGKPLQHVQVRFSVLRNPRDDRFQTPQLMTAWSTWATDQAGAASAEIDAPWLGFVAPPAPQIRP